MVTQEFQMLNQSNSVVEESFSFLKANFNFSNVDKQYKSLAIISSNPKEGKTTIAMNLSMNFANDGVRTLLVDTDLRKPIKAKKLTMSVEKGLSNYLTENLNLEDIILPSNVDNLYYIPCGSTVISPAAMLTSEGFEDFLKLIRLKYELIIFDTPAISSVVDGYIIASKTDAAILIIKAGEVGLPKLKRVKTQLQKANVNVIGVVLNSVERSEYRKNLEAYDYFSKGFKFSKRMKK